MPEEEKRKGPGDIPVDIDTSGPEVDVDIETKEDAVETAPETTEQETKEIKEMQKKFNLPHFWRFHIRFSNFT